MFKKRKTILLTAGVILLTLVSFVAGGQFLNSRQQAVNLRTQQVKISEADVKRIIAEYTGINDLNIESIILENDNDYSNPHYDVDTNKDGVEHDFDIDAVTGDVLSYSSDNNGFRSSQTSTSSSTNQAIISESDVKKIVEETTGQKDLAYAYLNLTWDDGRQVYDIKATKGNMVYELEILASTGQVLSNEQKAISTAADNNSLTSKAKISEKEAREIVEKTTGIKSLNYTEIELSQDDDYNGALVYEITAYADGVEYDLDIDATTGQVLKSSAERDND